MNSVELKVADGSNIPRDAFDLKLYYCWGENASASCLNDSSPEFIDLVELAKDNGSSSFSFALGPPLPGEDFLSFSLEATNHKRKDPPEGEDIIDQPPEPQHFQVVLESIFDPCSAYSGKGYTETNEFLADTNKSWSAGIDRYETTKEIKRLSVKDLPKKPWKNENPNLADPTSCPGGICKTPAGEKMTFEALTLHLTLPDLPLTPLPQEYHDVERTYSLRRNYTDRSLADQEKSNPADRLDCWIRTDFNSKGKSGAPCDW